jgi:hypothetical protein
MVGPDGSKEGWEPSEDGDIRRKLFCDWLEDTGAEWAEVAFYDEEGYPEIERASNLEEED